MSIVAPTGVRVDHPNMNAKTMTNANFMILVFLECGGKRRTSRIDVSIGNINAIFQLSSKQFT